MTPAEMQALWKEVQQAQAAQAGHPPLPIPGLEDTPKSLANGVPTPPAAASQLSLPGAGSIPNGVPEGFLAPGQSHILYSIELRFSPSVILLLAVSVQRHN